MSPRRLTRRRLFARAAEAGAAMLPLAACGAPAKPSPPPRGPFATREALRASLAVTGVSSADQASLIDLALPAVALPSTAATDDAIALGASKIGGAPDLPRGMAWPTRAPSAQALNDVGVYENLNRKDPSDYYRREIAARKPLAQRSAPLAFMLQVDLAACAAAGPMDPDMPRQGLLLVFYDLVFKPWRGRDKDGNALFQTLYVENRVENLARQTPPDLGYPLFGADLPDYRNRLPPARLSPVFTYTLPDEAAVPMMRYMDGDMPNKAWLKAAPTHLDATNRLGGWAELIQGDMRIDLAAEDAGVELPSGPDYMLALPALSDRIKEWVLLLQVGDYDNKINDFDGLYYIWIKRADLRARDFTKARLIYQTD